MSKKEAFFGLTSQSSSFLKTEKRLSSVKLLDPFTCGWKHKATVVKLNYLDKFCLIPVFVAGPCRDSVRSSRDTFVGKDGQFSVLHPPCSGWIHFHLGVPAEEPTHSSQEEAHSLLLHTHLTQRR